VVSEIKGPSQEDDEALESGGRGRDAGVNHFE
jgi:hypothetical protein